MGSGAEERIWKPLLRMNAFEFGKGRIVCGDKGAGASVMSMLRGRVA